VAELDCDAEAIVLEGRSTDSHAGTYVPAAPPELSHAEVRARLSDHFEDGLPASDAGQIERHLANCADCRAFSRTLYQTVRGLRSLGTRPAPADAKRRLRERTVQAATQQVR
jgi:anti-sigma factor RsiW